MNRRSFVAAASLSLWVAGFPATAEASTRLDSEVMKAALRTATPEEEGFIGRVVDLVDQGALPASLVDTTFQWARRKGRHQFQYFKRAMILRAAQVGVEL